MVVGAAAGCGTRRSGISLAAPRAFNRYCRIDAITNVHSLAVKPRSHRCSRETGSWNFSLVAFKRPEKCRGEELRDVR